MLGIVGLLVAVYVVVRSTGLSWCRGVACTTGGSSHAASKKEFMAAYVNEQNQGIVSAAFPGRSVRVEGS
ncbi:MAG TPA: hypothetical protein VF443_09040 [Nitrospira sp.]